MLRRRAEFTRSAVFRVSLIHALLMTAGLGISLVSAWIAMDRCVEMLARDRVSIEVDSLLVEFRQEGLDGVSRAIEARFSQRGSLHYLLLADGRTMGDLTQVPHVPGWHRVQIRSTASELMSMGQGDNEILAKTVRTPNGVVIAVGEDLGPSEVAKQMLFGAMLPIGLVALALGVFLSIKITRRTLRRMDEIVGVVRAVENGNMTARVKSPNRLRDDIDALGTAVNRMLDRTDTLVATIGRVSAEIAHDLRTPLSHVRHAVHAARWSQDELERGISLDRASAGIVRALRLFDAMLRLAEIDAGQVQAHFEGLDVAALAEQVLDAYRAEIEASGRTLDCSCEQDCRVWGDADLLTQAVANLLDNALKHSRAGAAITLRISCDDRLASIAVEDDGPGIAPADIETVLRPFGRLDEARRTPGNGLGLAITSSIAKFHGGQLRIANGKAGLCATIDLPRSGDAEAS